MRRALHDGLGKVDVLPASRLYRSGPSGPTCRASACRLGPDFKDLRGERIPRRDRNHHGTKPHFRYREGLDLRRSRAEATHRAAGGVSLFLAEHAQHFQGSECSSRIVVPLHVRRFLPDGDRIANVLFVRFDQEIVA